jgi:hypothetical protein
LQTFETEINSDENIFLLVTSFLSWIITSLPTARLHRFEIKAIKDGKKLQVRLKLNSEEYNLLRKFVDGKYA